VSIELIIIIAFFAAGLAFEATDGFKAAYHGWKYVFSKRFRKQINNRWKGLNKFRVIWEILRGVEGIAFSLAIIFVIISLSVGLDWIKF